MEYVTLTNELKMPILGFNPEDPVNETRLMGLKIHD